MKHQAKRLKKVAFVLFAMSESIASKSKERKLKTHVQSTNTNKTARP